MLILLQKNFMQFSTQEQKKNKQREELEKSKNQNILD